MKKFVSLLLTLVMVLSLMAACGIVKEETVAGPANSLEVLTNIWALYGDNEKFSVYGGNPKENFEDNVWDVPANYDLADENMTFNLLIPADQVANVDDVASMTHGMMANNFNSAVFHVTGSTDAAAFADALYQSVAGNMWICGMPERVLIADVGGNYVVMAYGVADPMNSFETHLSEAYPSVNILYNEPLA